MAGKSKQDDDIIVDINVTPLVDVILVLLIIFMVTTQMMTPPSIPVELPKASTGEASKTSPLAITIRKQKGGAGVQYFLNGKPVTEKALEPAIAGIVQKKGKKKVQGIIAADKQVMFGRVVTVLDMLRRLGIEDYAFNIDPTPDNAPASPTSSP